MAVLMVEACREMMDGAVDTSAVTMDEAEISTTLGLPTLAIVTATAQSMTETLLLLLLRVQLVDSSPS